MLHARTVRPRDHLLDPGGTVRVGGDDQRLATLVAQLVRELPCGRRLPRPIDSIEQHAGGITCELKLAWFGGHE